MEGKGDGTEGKVAGLSHCDHFLEEFRNSFLNEKISR